MTDNCQLLTFSSPGQYQRMNTLISVSELVRLTPLGSSNTAFGHALRGLFRFPASQLRLCPGHNSIHISSAFFTALKIFPRPPPAFASRQSNQTATTNRPSPGPANTPPDATKSTNSATLLKRNLTYFLVLMRPTPRSIQVRQLSLHTKPPSHAKSTIYTV